MGIAACTQKNATVSEPIYTASNFTWTDETILEFLTDVEGNWEYVINFVEHSRVLRWVGDPRGVWGPGTLDLNPNCVLVFGGDAPDKGPGDIRIVKTLLQLKARYPQQVYLLIGNRDLMKLRVTAELHPKCATPAWIPPWEPKAIPYEKYLENAKLSASSVSKLKWMLHWTMGCQDTTFKTRKEELALLYGTATDEDVFRSYLSAVDPYGTDPWMLQYLKVGQILLVLRGTLFVHGGLQDESIGFVPGRDDKCKNLIAWANELNAWKDHELSEFERDPHFRTTMKGDVTRSGAELIRYGTPGFGNLTVIYHNPFVDGNPVQQSSSVRKFLQESGINRVLSGHQPHGQSPTVVRHPDTNLLVITCDTSRSDSRGSKLFNPANNRGLAVSVVSIQGESVCIEGKLADDTEHRCTLHTDPDKDTMPDALVGRQLENNAWVKAVVKDREIVITALGKGFRVDVERMHMQRASLKLREEYRTGVCRGDIKDVRAEWLRMSSRTVEFCPEAEDRVSEVARSYAFDRAAFESLETYIFAPHGVLLEGPPEVSAKIIQNINQLLAQRKRVIFVTNDSRYTRNEIFARLQQRGIQFSESEHHRKIWERKETGEKQKLADLQQGCVISSANTCAWFLKQAGIKKPFVICSEKGLIEELAEVGITSYKATVDAHGHRRKEFLEPVSSENVAKIISRDPDVDAVVVGWDQQMTMLTVAVAVQYLMWSEEVKGKGKGIPLISCSMDPAGTMGFTPNDFNVSDFRNLKLRCVGNGTMTRAICHCHGSKIKPIDMGKPSEALLEHLRLPLSQGGLEIDLRKAVVIGDTLETDIKLANLGGMRSLLVLSGVTGKVDLEKEVNPQHLPTWVVENFACI